MSFLPSSEQSAQEREGQRRPRLYRRVVMLLAALCAAVMIACEQKGELLEQAQAAWDSGDYQGAAAIYEDFLKRNPQHELAAAARFRAANTYYYNLKNHERAIQHYVHLIEEFPRSSEVTAARQRIGECYAALGKHREAINEYESLLASGAEGIDRRRMRLNIADLYYDLNDLGQALAEYEKVVGDGTYDSIGERAWLRIAGIRFLRDEYEDALEAYRQVAEKATDPAIRRQASFGMVDCYERTFEYEQAIRLIEQIPPDPSHPDYGSRRIAALREQQRQRNFSVSTAARP